MDFFHKELLCKLFCLKIRGIFDMNDNFFQMCTNEILNRRLCKL